MIRLGWLALAAQIAALVVALTGHTRTALTLMSVSATLLWFVIIRLRTEIARKRS